MTFDRECQICGDKCYEEKYSGKKEEDPIVGVEIFKSFRYYDNRCICIECEEEIKKDSRFIQKPDVQGELIKDWRY